MKKPSSIILSLKILTIFIVFYLFLPISALYADTGVPTETLGESYLNLSTISNSGLALYEDEINWQ